MDSDIVYLAEHANQEVLSCLLKSQKSAGLNSVVEPAWTSSTEQILYHFTDKALEWKFSDQQIGTFLVPSDLTQSYRSWTVSVWSFYSTNVAFVGLGFQQHPGSLTPRTLSRGLLGSSHGRRFVFLGFVSSEIQK